MKKLHYYFVVFLLSSPISAQVTLHTNHLPENYFYNYWYEVDSLSQTMESTSQWTVSQKAFAKQFVTTDSIQIWGIAASLESLVPWIIEYDIVGSNGEIVHVVDSSDYYSTIANMCDTGDYDEAYEFFGLYRRVSDSLQLFSPQLTVNIKTTPVTYYVDMGTMDGPGSNSRTRPFAVYEVFFDEPVTIGVVDTFYVGMTSRIFYHKDKCDSAQFYTWPIFWRLIRPYPGPLSYPDQRAWFQPNPNGDEGTWSFCPYSTGLFYVFPILDTLHRNDYIDTNYIDSTSHGDTVSISNNPMESFLSLLPNPAKDVVQIVSSVDIMGIEAFNMQGVKVMEMQVLGRELFFAVKTWPKGVYLLRARTHLGFVYKRLIVK